VKREAEKVEHTTHRQAAAPVCELGSNPNKWSRSRRALEDAGVIFIDRGIGGGPEVRLPAGADT
jgi:hypothetical protein